MQGYRVVFPEANKALLERFDTQTLDLDEVLIENEFSVISAGTERANLIALPNTQARFPKYPGYSAVGHVIEKGAAVSEIAVGERVIVYFGGHCSHSVKKAEELVTVPKEVQSLDACLVVIAGMALQGVRKLKLELGESSLVIGQGLLGLFSVQFCKLSGGLPVVSLDNDCERLELSKDLGADYVFTPDRDKLREMCMDITHGHGFRAIVEVTGSSSGLEQALHLIAPRGRISLLGCTRISKDPIDFYRYVHLPGVSLIGAHTFVRPKHDSYPGYWTHSDDHRALLGFIAAGRLQVAPLISQIVSPSCAPQVYERLAKNPCAPLGIVFDWKQVRKKGEQL
jgi:2-desacetyl-2-hydroxyethyl bacteriochlorophyllide A dehydrogenase